MIEANYREIDNWDTQTQRFKAVELKDDERQTVKN